LYTNIKLPFFLEAKEILLKHRPENATRSAIYWYKHDYIEQPCSAFTKAINIPTPLAIKLKALKRKQRKLPNCTAFPQNDTPVIFSSIC